MGTTAAASNGKDRTKPRSTQARWGTCMIRATSGATIHPIAATLTPATSMMVIPVRAASSMRWFR